MIAEGEEGKETISPLLFQDYNKYNVENLYHFMYYSLFVALVVIHSINPLDYQTEREIWKENQKEKVMSF